jgi:hypothetical protein
MKLHRGELERDRNIPQVINIKEIEKIIFFNWKGGQSDEIELKEPISHSIINKAFKACKPMKIEIFFIKK